MTVVSDYVDAVRRELEDIPEAERAELLDDVEPHIAEVASELGEELSVYTLRARLGSPEEYADELRATAGYPQAGKIRKRLRLSYPSTPKKVQRAYLLLVLAGIGLLGFLATREPVVLLGSVAVAILGGVLISQESANLTNVDTVLRPRLAFWLLAGACVAAAATGLQARPFSSASLFITGLLLSAMLALVGFWTVRSEPAAVMNIAEIRRPLAFAKKFQPDSAPSWWTTARPYLRTAWWVLRGWVIAICLGWALGIDSSSVLVPSIASLDGLVSGVLILIGVAGSIWLGSRAREDSRIRWHAMPVNALALGAVMVFASASSGSIQYWLSGSAEPASYRVEPERVEVQVTDKNALIGTQRQKIRNLYVFDANGNLLTDVFVYDQAGRPVVLPLRACANSQKATEVQRDNRFPHIEVRSGWREDTGREYCKVAPGLPFEKAKLAGAIPGLAPGPAPTTTPTTPPATSVPTPSPTTTPTIPVPDPTTAPTPKPGETPQPGKSPTTPAPRK